MRLPVDGSGFDHDAGGEHVEDARVRCRLEAGGVLPVRDFGAGGRWDVGDGGHCELGARFRLCQAGAEGVSCWRAYEDVGGSALALATMGVWAGEACGERGRLRPVGGVSEDSLDLRRGDSRRRR